MWEWLLAMPGATMGSARALRTGLAQGKRQNALAEETRRRSTTINIKSDRKRPKKKAVRGMSLQMLAFPGST